MKRGLLQTNIRQTARASLSTRTTNLVRGLRNIPPLSLGSRHLYRHEEMSKSLEQRQPRCLSGRTSLSVLPNLCGQPLHFQPRASSNRRASMSLSHHFARQRAASAIEIRALSPIDRVRRERKGRRNKLDPDEASSYVYGHTRFCLMWRCPVEGRAIPFGR